MMHPADRPIRIAVTLGDPAGIGAEIALKSLADPEIQRLAEWILVGDGAVVAQSGATLGISPAHLPRVSIHEVGALGERPEVRFGQLSAACGRAAVEYVRVATEMCQAGAADGMVTAPLNKEAVTLSGIPFSGHTEFIAELCGVRESRMLLVNDRLSVVHVSTHVALRRACELQSERIFRTIELGQQAMAWLGHDRPRIAVCGLNPHAGEHGLFGSEDEELIRPAVERARARGWLCQGPQPPDTVFLQGVRGAWDLVVAMYHDQGHIPMKLLDFERTVNVSLGIPIVRTSVDHGTAFDIAGQGRADPENMKAALRLGAAMAGRRARGSGPATAIAAQEP